MMLTFFLTHQTKVFNGIHIIFITETDKNPSQSAQNVLRENRTGDLHLIALYHSIDKNNYPQRGNWYRAGFG